MHDSSDSSDDSSVENNHPNSINMLPVKKKPEKEKAKWTDAEVFNGKIQKYD
jgi:hypothetical protein